MKLLGTLTSNLLIGDLQMESEIKELHSQSVHLSTYFPTANIGMCQEQRRFHHYCILERRLDRSNLFLTNPFRTYINLAEYSYHDEYTHAHR